MHILKQMDPNLHREIRRRQTQAWDDLIAAFTDTWDRWAGRRRTHESPISVEEVLADLSYGRD